MKNLIIVTVLITFFSAISGCQTTKTERIRISGIDDVPSYLGAIEPLTEPVFFRHGPFEKTASNGLITSTYLKDGKFVWQTKVQMQGSIWSDRVGGKNALTYKYDDISIKAAAEPIEIKDPIYARILISDHGQISSFTWSGEEQFTKYFPPEVNTSKLLELSIRNAIISYPDHAISQNGKIIVSKVTANGQSVQLYGIVKGRVDYEGEHGVLMDVLVKSNFSKGDAPIGYMIISKDNGRTLLSKTMLIIDNHENKPGLSVRMETTVH